VKGLTKRSENLTISVYTYLCIYIHIYVHVHTCVYTSGAGPAYAGTLFPSVGVFSI